MGKVRMRVWDVKHGSAILILTPNNKTFVIDLGRGDYSQNSDDRSPLETLKQHYKISNIDHLTITHPHKDHIDDILNLDKLGLTVTTLLRPKWLDKAEVMKNVSSTDKPKFEKYFGMNDHYNLDVSGSEHDYSIPANSGGIKIKRFHTADLPQSNINNHSIVSVLEYETIKVVIPGDNECASLDLLMERDDFKAAIKNCDVLIAPHHGRDSAYHSEFVELANPRLTVISDGSVKDTSANGKYSANSRGWGVYSNGTKTERKLLTTNCDGEIYINFGRPSPADNPFLNVELKKK